jgi:hypothetical protein
MKIQSKVILVSDYLIFKINQSRTAHVLIPLSPAGSVVELDSSVTEPEEGT